MQCADGWRRSGWLLAVVLGGVMLPAAGRSPAGPAGASTFPVRFVGADEVARLIRAAKVEGLEVAGAPGGKLLFASGPPAALKQVPDLVRLTDIAPRVVDLSMKITRTTAGAAPEVLGAPAVRCLNGKEASIKLSDIESLEATVTPRVNGDNSVTLSILFVVELQDGHLCGIRRTLRWAAGAPVRVAFTEHDAPEYALEIVPTPQPIMR